MVTIKCGANSMSSSNLIGQTIGDLRSDEGLCDRMGINADQGVQVKSGNVEFVDKNDNYVIQDGDTVRFSRTVGTKGC